MKRYIVFVVAMIALGWAIADIFGTSTARMQPVPVPMPTSTPVVTPSPQQLRRYRPAHHRS